MARSKWSKAEINEYRKKNGAIFYFNKEDSNLFIPKMYGFGFTFNWANPLSWVLIIALFGIIVFGKYFNL